MASLLTPQQVMAELRQQQYKPVYFLQGEEAYYIDLITTYIAGHIIISEEEKKLNLTSFHDKKQTIEQIILHAQQVPLIGKRKVIIVKEAQKLFDLQKASSRKLLIHYIKRPSQHSLVVFAYKSKLLDPNDGLAKALGDAHMLISCKTPYASQIPGWIQEYVHEKGYSIEQNAALELQMMIGKNLQVLANELQKTLIGLPMGSVIKRNIIAGHIQSSRAFTLFDLQQALCYKNAEKTRCIVQSFIQNPKKHPITQTISYLTAFFAKLLQLHDKPLNSATQVGKYLQIHPYLASSYIHAMQKYTLAQTLQNIHHLHQADLQAKGINFPNLSEESILKELIAKLIDPMPIMTEFFEQTIY